MSVAPDSVTTGTEARGEKFSGVNMTKEASLSHEPMEGHAITADGEIFINGQLLNIAGHKQEVKRNYSMWALCAVAVVIGDCWAVQGASVVCREPYKRLKTS